MAPKKKTTNKTKRKTQAKKTNSGKDKMSNNVTDNGGEGTLVVDNEEPSVPVFAKAPGSITVEVPKRKRKKTKEEEAFWRATEKKLAQDAIADAGELSLKIPRISTGNFGLDVALYGGIPQGRIVRFWGLPKSGKTGSCLNTVATFQKYHCSECYQRECDCTNRDVPQVIWVDAENRMNQMLYWPAAHGINLDCMKVMCPPTGQNVVDLVDHIIRSESIAKIGLIVVDSLANITSKDVLNKATLDGTTVGRNAYLLNTAFQKWTSAVHSLGIKNDRKPTILCINQIRQKVGVLYGNPETMPGGMGQEFATSVDVRFSAGYPTYVVFDEKKQKWVAKEKKSGSTFKPPPDATPDFVNIRYRVTASGICPSGRYGEFNYWLKNAHGHRCGDPDNGLQLWNYSKRYGLIKQEEGLKHLFGQSARTLDELKEKFRQSPEAITRAWSYFAGILYD